MQKIIYKAKDRGAADYGWLKTHYTFSFSGYYNPARMHFGAIRVLNDDTILGGGGFPTHPHDNMEIVTIPFSGALAHEDSTGGKGIIRKDEIQAMSAGTGLQHSEFNNSDTEPVSLFQIWIFPKERGIAPVYRQQTFDPADRKNKLQTMIAPDGTAPLSIHQDAWFTMGAFDKGEQTRYVLHQPAHGLFLMVIEGEVEAAGEKLGRRDAVGVWDIDDIDIKISVDKTEVLLMEVPMQV